MDGELPPDYSDGELDKNDNPNNGAKGDDDGSQGGSGDEDVIIQAAAIAGDMHNEAGLGKFHVVDENTAQKVRNRTFFFLF